MELELRHLRLLVVVADAGSVSAAACSLGVSQPSLSAQVNRIEASLGGQVFERSRAGVTLTPLGELVTGRSRSLLRDLEELVDEVHKHAVDRQLLRVGATTSRFFSVFLTKLAESGLARELVPRVDVSSSVMTDHLLNGECDLGVIGAAIGYAKPCPDRLREIVIVDREPLLVAMSAAHPSATKDEVDLADFGADDWILPPGKPDATYAALLDLFRQTGISPGSRLGRQDLGQYWDYVAAGHAVSLALPGNVASEGAVILPIRGAPISWRRVVRWNPETVSDDEAERCAWAAVRAYQELLLCTAPLGEWWHRTPEHRPTLNAEISERAGVGPLGVGH